MLFNSMTQPNNKCYSIHTSTCENVIKLGKCGEYGIVWSGARMGIIQKCMEEQNMR